MNSGSCGKTDDVIVETEDVACKRGITALAQSIMPMANEKRYVLAAQILKKIKYEVTNRIIVQLQSCQIITWIYYSDNTFEPEEWR